METIPLTSGLGEEFDSFSTEVLGFKTGRGSKYAYFDNGKVQRYKTVDNEYREPSDIIVFVPSFEWFKRNAPIEMRDLFPDEKSFDVNLVLLAQGSDISPKIVDAKGNVLKSGEDLKKPGVVYLAFTTKRSDGQRVTKFYLPVAKAPRVGFNTFDMRFGEETTSRHLGNKVTEITRGKALPASQIMPWRERDPHEIS